MKPHAGAPVTVISIVGAGRSGSTLLARILGQLPNALNLGELRWLWARGVQQQRPCSCGRPPRECPLWSRVLEKTLGGTAAPAAAVGEILAAQRRLAPRSLHPWERPAWERPELRPAMDLMARAACELVLAVVAETGARVVVDASKRPVDAAILASLPGARQHVVHLVRDPRAVAHSWGRTKVLPPGSGRDVMARRSPASSAVRWVDSMVACERLRGRVMPVRWHVLRYEDLVADPVRRVGELCERLGQAPPDCLADDGVALPLGHSVAGNPSRFVAGHIPIRMDDEWLWSMPRRDQWLVTALTLAWLSRFGYPVSSARSVCRP